MATYGVPTIGSKVLTSEGRQLGRVKNLSGDCFKVDAPLQPDYWLAMDTIATNHGDEVLMSFSRNDLGKMVAEGRSTTGAPPHVERQRCSLRERGRPVGRSLRLYRRPLHRAASLGWSAE